METLTQPPAPRSLVLFGVPFHDVTFEETIAWCVARMRSGPPACLATANVDFLMQATRDPELQRILLESELVIADGMPIVWASKRLGPPLRQRVTGSDLTPLLAAACAREGFRVFLLGAGPQVAERAAEVLVKRNPGLIIAGTYSPPLRSILDMDHADILARLRSAKPHLLLVAFGAPKQEKFIAMHLRTWGIPLAIGVGGTLDFLAGTQSRAPVWVQRIGFEWLWRMSSDPKRLYRRYAENVRFLAGAFRRQRRLRDTPSETAVTPNPGSDWSSLRDSAVASERFVFFDLGDRTWLDSEELGRLVHAAKLLRQRDGRLLLHGGTERVRRLLREAGLTEYLEYASSLEDVRRRSAELEDERQRGVAQLKGNCLELRLPAELDVARLGAWSVRVDAVWSPAVRRVVVDAAGMRFIDSAALGWLIALRKRCQDQRSDFECGGFQGPPLQTLRLAKIDALFQTC